MFHQLLRCIQGSEEDCDDQTSVSPSNSVYEEVIPLTAYLDFTKVGIKPHSSYVTGFGNFEN